MSIFVTNVSVTQFESDVHAEFQAKGFRTRESIRLRNNVVGATISFPVSSQGIAQQKSLQADIVPMNIEYHPVPVTLTNWHASDYSDIFAQADINFDERMELVKVSAMSIGRRMDQMVIDALDAATPATIIVDGGTNFTYEKMREAVAGLHANNAGDGGIYCLISAAAESQLLDEKKLTSSFFVNQKVIDNGGLQGLKLAGINWIVIGNMTEGGLPLSGNIRQCFMYDKQALGMGIGIDFRTEINYVPNKLSWLVSSVFKAGAVAIDPLGIAQIAVDESVITSD
jgi:hypothetical protein